MFAYSLYAYTLCNFLKNANMNFTSTVYKVAGGAVSFCSFPLSLRFWKLCSIFYGHSNRTNQRVQCVIKNKTIKMPHNPLKNKRDFELKALLSLHNLIAFCYIVLSLLNLTQALFIVTLTVSKMSYYVSLQRREMVWKLFPKRFRTKDPRDNA